MPDIYYIEQAIANALMFTKANGEKLTHGIDMKGKPKYKIDDEKVILVLMMGPRECGKTSALTSIQRCITNVVSSTSVNFVPRQSSGEIMFSFSEKENALIRFADNPIDFKDNNVSKIEATSELNIYDFVMYHSSNEKNIQMVRFVDVPGEYYEYAPEAMQPLINRSNMFIIAVDTPSLLSGNQAFCMEYNNVNKISDYFLHLDPSEVNNLPRLILFMPLKCEKYYWADIRDASQQYEYMNRIIKEIKEQYKTLINRMTTESHYKNITMAITPVQTVGGVVFADYDKKTKQQIYMPDKHVKGYNPVHCEQPLFYLLAFISNILERVSVNDSFFDVIKRSFPVVKNLMLEKDEQFKNGLKQLAEKSIINKEGFHIISDAGNYLNINRKSPL